MTHFYTRLRDGSFSTQKRPPARGKAFVQEIFERSALDSQMTFHNLIAYDSASAEVRAEVFAVAVCGYDRGPGHTKILRDLFSRI